jgi:hypothetical protein
MPDFLIQEPQSSELLSPMSPLNHGSLFAPIAPSRELEARRVSNLDYFQIGNYYLYIVVTTSFESVGKKSPVSNTKVMTFLSRVYCTKNKIRDMET